MSFDIDLTAQKYVVMNYANVKYLLNTGWICLLCLGLFTACTTQRTYSAVDTGSNPGAVGFDRDHAQWSFNTWDINRDGYLTQAELNTNMYTTLDSDRDTRLTEQEWRVYEEVYMPSATGTFNTWDTNSNGYLDTYEFNSGLESSTLYQTWDTNRDGWIDNAEFDQGLSSTWNTNELNTWDQ